MNAQTHGFRSELSVTWISKRRWRLNEPLVYTDKHGRTWTVPEGYETDFASIPRWFRWLVARDAELAMAATLHDWLIEWRKAPYRLCDWLFFEAARSYDVRPVRAWVAYKGTRIGSYWRRWA